MNVLAVNPWVHDFAYHDLYAKPYGLLMLSSLFAKTGHNVTYLDLLANDKFSVQGIKRKKDGTGSFYREKISKGWAYRNIEADYYRFGLPPAELIKHLHNIQPPDIIIVSSGMTYWYTGVIETISSLKTVFPLLPVYLGGVYATLLTEHATQHSGAEYVFSGDAGSFLNEYFKIKIKSGSILPDLEQFYERLYYVPILTTTGCPFHCAYCASKSLVKGINFLSVDDCVDYIGKYTAFYKTDVVAFYDDALLYEREKHFYPLLDKIISRGLNLRFYTPNGLHIRYIDKQCACLLKKAGFQKIRLSLEFTEDNITGKYGAKTVTSEFDAAVAYLREAGFMRKDIGTYLLCGLSGQTKSGIKKSIDYVYSCGGTPYLSEYSPVPGSELFETDKLNSIFDLNEPLYQNNSILPMQSPDFTYMDFLELKKYNRKKRSEFF